MKYELETLFWVHKQEKVERVDFRLNPYNWNKDKCHLSPPKYFENILIQKIIKIPGHLYLSGLGKAYT